MANVIISKTKFRRGSNDQRKAVIFDQGEPVFTTDTQRLYVGIGSSLSGGVVIGSKVHQPLINYYSLSNTIAEIGDVVYANNKFYQLTATNYSNVNSWADINIRLNTDLFSYDSQNKLQINTASISAIYLDPDTIGEGLKLDSGLLQLDYDTTFFEIDVNSVSLKADSVTEREINSTALSYGLSGGSGDKIQLDVDSTYFQYQGNTLSLVLTSLSGAFEFSDLNPDWFGSGLNYDGINELITTTISAVDNGTIENDNGTIGIKPSVFGTGLAFNGTNSLSTIIANVDSSTIVRNSAGVISSTVVGSVSTRHMPNITVDQYGRVAAIQTAIYDLLEMDTASPSLSIFNGAPDGDYAGSNSVAVLSAKLLNNNTVQSLSSAGFIAFEGNYEIRNTGITIKRFAIPVFLF